jgi:hypothetical protein
MNKEEKRKIKKYGYLGLFLIQLFVLIFLCLIWLDPFPNIFIELEKGTDLSMNQYIILLISIASSLFLLYKIYEKFLINLNSERTKEEMIEIRKKEIENEERN